MLRFSFLLTLVLSFTNVASAAELPKDVTITSALWGRPSRFDLSIDNVFARKGFEKIDLPGLPESSIALNWLNRVYYHPSIGGRIFVRGSLAVAGSGSTGKIYRMNKRAYFSYVNSNLAGSHILFFEDMNESQATNLSRAIERAIGERKVAAAFWRVLFDTAAAGENEFCSESTLSPSEKNVALALLKGGMSCGLEVTRVLPPSASANSLDLAYTSLHPVATYEKLSIELSSISRVFGNFANAFGEFRPLIAKLAIESKVRMVCDLIGNLGEGPLTATLSAGGSSPTFIAALSKSTLKAVASLPTKTAAPLVDVSEKLSLRAVALSKVVTPVQTALNEAQKEGAETVLALTSASAEFERLELRDPATSLKRAHAFVGGVKNASNEFPFLRLNAVAVKPAEFSRALHRMNEGADMIRTRFALDPKQLENLTDTDRELELLIGNAYVWNLTELSERTRRVHLQLVTIIDDLVWGKNPAKLNPPREGWLTGRDLERFQELSRVRAAQIQKALAAFERFDSASHAIIPKKVESGVGIASCNVLVRTPAATSN